jgi:hypothetical protein
MPYRFFNADKAAQYLHLHRAELDRLVKARDIPFETRGDRTAFRQRDLDGWASCRILDASSGRLAKYHQRSWQRTCALPAGDMLLPDLIRPEQIHPAMTAKTKASVLRDLVALAQRTGWVCDPSELVASLQAREALCSTAVPGGRGVPPSTGTAALSFHRIVSRAGAHRAADPLRRTGRPAH